MITHNEKEGINILKGINFLLRQCWKYNKRYVVYVFAYQITSSLLPLIAVVLPKYIIDELMGAGRVKVVIGLVALLVGYNFLGGILTSILSNHMFTEKGPVFSEFQALLAEKLTEADLASLENPQFLDIAGKARKFLYANGQGFGVVLDSAVNILGKAFVFIGLIAIIATLNPLLVLVFIGLVLLDTFMESKVRKNYSKWDLEKTPIERKTNYLINLVEGFAYGKEMRIYNLRNWIMGKVRVHYKMSDEFYKKQIREYSKSSYFESFTSFLRECSTYAYLVWQVLVKSITIGDFTMYLSAIASFSGAMRDVMGSVLNIQQFSTYYIAVEEYMNVPKKMREGKNQPLPKNKEHVFKFENVYFKYDGKENYALENINIEIGSGEKLSVVGENGAGKTTFIKLLCRMYDPTEGRITLDGIDIREIEYDQYMSLFATVFQDFKLFSFTLKENIALAETDKASDEEIINILKNNGLDEKLQELNNDIHSSVYRNFEEDGFEPSGGEGQKIALSRAIFKNASVVVLDEPTSALDPRAEYELYKRFDELVLGKTSIYISHRLSSTRFCDKIAVFDKGQIIEYGKHDELIKMDKKYAELFNMQAQFYQNN